MEYSPELVFPVPIPYCYKPHKDMALLWWREFFLPNHRLQHDMLRKENSRYGKYDVRENEKGWRAYIYSNALSLLFV